MRRSCLFFVLLLIILMPIVRLAGQSTYESGYIVLEDGGRKTVSIYNYGWVNNPERFRYREPGSEETILGTLDDVTEFGLADGSLRYLRQSVNIDRSGIRPDYLSESSEPEYERVTVFLEWLVDGEVDLFRWEEKDNAHYFFRAGAAEPEELISRRYRKENRIYSREYFFRGQLRRGLNCEYLAEHDFRNLAYATKDLVLIIKAANACRDAQVTTSIREAKGRRFNLTARLGASHLSGDLRLDGPFGRDRLPLSGAVAPRIGLEVEYRIPLAGNRWGVFGELAYYHYATEKLGDEPRPLVSLDHRAAGLDLGVRRYVFFGDKFALFGQFAGSIKIPLDGSSISYRRSAAIAPLTLTSDWSFALGGGLGLSFDNTYLLSIEYFTDQDYLQTYLRQSTEVKALSVVLGYRF